MADAGLIFQRDGSMLVTGGDGLDRLLAIVRQVAQLRAIIAGNYVYDLSPVALWGAAARGPSAADLIAGLERWSTTLMPAPLAARIADLLGRYGALEIVERDSKPVLVARQPSLLREIGIEPSADGSSSIAIPKRSVARIKLAAAGAGWPVIDNRPIGGDERRIELRDEFRLRDYQSEAMKAFDTGRNGLILLPCGAGKTIVGIAAAASTGGPILILVPSRTVGEQWQSAFRAFTQLDQSDVGWLDESGNAGLVATVTYHAATAGNASGSLNGRRWRMVIYDEVQSLPADVFRLAAAIEADRRLGLSATLVREDSREAEVFALVGPPLYEASWLELERDGWIAPARCREIRVPDAVTTGDALRYKMAVVQRLVDLHGDEPTLIVGTGVAALQATGRRLGFPVLSGSSSPQQRAELFRAFRAGELTRLGLSRIGSVGIDLPDASVLIQISGTFGSRQEEAQRLGRILRPAAGKVASFYTIVAAGTREQHFAARRQRYLVNQGYQYEIVDAGTLPRTTNGGQ